MIIPSLYILTFDLSLTSFNTIFFHLNSNSQVLDLPRMVTSKSHNQSLPNKMCISYISETPNTILIARHVDSDLTMLGNKLSSLINSIHVVSVGMWFSLETHLVKSYLGNDIRTTIPIYHQFIVLPLMCNIVMEHTRPISILISNSCV